MSSGLTVIVGISTIFGITEALKETRSKARRDEHRSRKSNLFLKCAKSSQYSGILDGRRIVLSGDKLYIDTGTAYDVPFGHPFTGYFHPFPGTKFSGLISSISEDPPIHNWIYVDRETHEVKYGGKAWAEVNMRGPWDCTRQDRRLTFGGWEGFVVVQEGDFWALYFDKDGDLLRGKGKEGVPVLEVEVERKECRSKRRFVEVKVVKKEEGEGKVDEVKLNASEFEVITDEVEAKTVDVKTRDSEAEAESVEVKKEDPAGDQDEEFVLLRAATPEVD